jgi:small subunit ribosomal protein S17
MSTTVEQPDPVAGRGVRKERQGVVVSDKMQKTIVVRVSRRIRHPLYGKEMMQSRKYYAHDEKNEAKVGDTVRIAETRPTSRLKRWRLVDVVAKAKQSA